MQYLATYYWQSAKKNASSLVLQQAYHKRRKLPVLLACVCTDVPNKCEGNQLVSGLADWFYEAGLPLCSKSGEKGMRSICKSLEKCLQKETRNAGECRVAGVLCVGSSVEFFQRGGMGIRLLNLRKHRPGNSELRINEKGTPDMVLQNGILQSDVGILLATDSFYDCVSSEGLEECLNIRELCTQSRLERRLRELGEQTTVRGGSDIGAILLVTK